MQTYDIGLVPGPVSVPPELRAAYQINYGSAGTNFLDYIKDARPIWGRSWLPETG